jgi:hypothetical protein
MSFASQTARFNAQASRHRAECYPCTVTAAGVAEPIACAKSPTKITRLANEQGTGFVQRAIAVFAFPASGEFAPSIGSEWTIATCSTASEVGTAWRCFEFTRASALGNDHRCVCFRLD